VHYAVNVDYTINMSGRPSGEAATPWISAEDAARQLGVARATLYAYVSRGMVRSERGPGPSRARRYASEDIERLRRRVEERREPDKAAARALRWGVPVLESTITLIANDRLYYRGHDAVELARSRSVAEVAALIWTGQLDAPLAARGRLALRAPSGRNGPFIPRAQCMLAAAAARDAAAMDLRPEAVPSTGWRILDLLTQAATGSGGSDSAVEDRLATGWRVPRLGREILRAALILCADHELSVSAFTARCVASAGANPYDVVIASLSALAGTKHGGATVRAGWLLASLQQERSVRAALVERMRRGETIAGFGHPLYPSGDPRARAVLELLRERYRASAELRTALRVADVARSILHQEPNLDFALATLERVLGLPPASGLAVFAVGRSLGWIGHAIEQYATGQLIRPRAKYVGPVPTLG